MIGRVSDEGRGRGREAASAGAGRWRGAVQGQRSMRRWLDNRGAWAMAAEKVREQPRALPRAGCRAAGKQEVSCIGILARTRSL
jgi:hypothetical protein